MFKCNNRSFKENLLLNKLLLNDAEHTDLSINSENQYYKSKEFSEKDFYFVSSLVYMHRYNKSTVANEKISIDLDDGVKHNYGLFQGIKVPTDSGKEVKIKDNIRKGDIVKILDRAFTYLNNNNYEYNSVHKGNRNFKVENDIALDEIPIITKSLQVNDFCHKEIDREYPVETLYCFKLFIEENEDLNDTLIKICGEEILVKFKFRQTTRGDLFIMSLHYPDPYKEPWTWIWR